MLLKSAPANRNGINNLFICHYFGIGKAFHAAKMKNISRYKSCMGKNEQAKKQKEGETEILLVQDAQVSKGNGEK